MVVQVQVNYKFNFVPLEGNTKEIDKECLFLYEKSKNFCLY